MRTSNGVKKYIFNFSILISAVIFSVIIINNAAAQSNDISSDALSKLTYPIIELGSCKDRADCKIYCDDSANTAACVSYAEKKNLLSQEDLQIAKKFVATGCKGPGNCNGKEECQTYCEDKAHIDECVSYAENNGLMSVQDLQKAKKVQAAIKKGVKFPSCNNKKECDTYCEEANHMEECITFAQEAGLLSDEELQNTQKVLTALKQGIKPPPCKGKEACDTYCAEESNTDECTNFAIAAGLVTSEEAKIIKETGGKGPGGCKNKNECDSYCSVSGNQESCLNFAVEHNLISQEQFNQIKQGGGPSGPGGGAGSGNGAGQGQGGPGAGTGPGNGAGQGGGPNEGQGFNPGSGQGGQGQGVNPNPVKCIEDCEYVGKTCMGQAGDEGKVCASEGQYCRTVYCETYGVQGDNRPTQEQYHACNDNVCTPAETRCNDAVTAKDSTCRTTKDVCVMQCQKASKPTKPTPPTQPSQSNQPSQSTRSLPPAQPSQSTIPTQPATGKCGDGICGRMEQADPALCPQDCGG